MDLAILKDCTARLYERWAAHIGVWTNARQLRHRCWLKFPELKDASTASVCWQHMRCGRTTY